MAVASAVLGLYFLGPKNYIEFEHSFYAGVNGQLFLGVVFGLGAVGWLWGDFRLQPGHLVCAAGCALIVSLRGAVYDYYLIDVAMLGLFSVLPQDVSTDWPTGALRKWRVFSCVGAAACVFLAGFEIFFVGKHQRILDRVAAVIRLCEPALREGRIAPCELGVGSFGYAGWHLYPYFIRHDGAYGAYIANFENYYNRNSLAVSFVPCSGDREKQAAHIRETRGQAGVVDCGVFEVGFRGPHFFVLRRTGQASVAVAKIDPEKYRLEPFPLNDGEWRQLIREKRLK